MAKWYYNSYFLTYRFNENDVIRITISGNSEKDICDKSTIKKIKSLYNKMEVERKIDTYQESPCTPDNILTIELSNGDHIAIEDFGYLFVTRDHRNESGKYSSDRYGYL